MSASKQLTNNQIKALQLCDNLRIRPYCRALHIHINTTEQDSVYFNAFLLSDGISQLFDLLESRFQAVTKSGRKKELNLEKVINKIRAVNHNSFYIHLKDAETKKIYELELYTSMIDIKDWKKAEQALNKKEPFDLSVFDTKEKESTQ